MKWNKISKTLPKIGKRCIFLTGSGGILYELGARFNRVEGHIYTTKLEPVYWLYIDAVCPPHPNK